MNIPSTVYLFSFIPIIAFALALWAGIRGKKQFGQRPLHLLVSIIFFAAIGGVALAVELLPFLFPPSASLALFTLTMVLYIVTFYLAEYSVHSQRLVRSFFSDEFRSRLTPLFVFIVILSLLSLTAFLFHFSDLSAGPKDEAVTFPRDALLAVLFLGACLVFVLFVNRRIFDFRKSVIRRNRLLNVFLLVTLGLFAVGFAIRRFTGAVPLWLHLLNNIAFIIRLTDEYFFQRMANLDRSLSKQDESLRMKNDLISKVVNSPPEEDHLIIRASVSGEIDRARAFMSLPEQGISGMIIYTRDGNLLRVATPDHIDGFCVPIARLEMLKLYKTKDQCDDIILRLPFNVHTIAATPADLLPAWGEKLIKEMLETKKGVVVSDVPPELKGLHMLVALYPVFDRDYLSGMIVVFKDNFNRLFPEEEHALETVVDNLTVIFSIIKGKQIQRERNRLQGELEIATKIQTSIVPKQIDLEGYECYAGMTTASEVGGDVYDYLKTEYGTYLGIGDVSGHGLPSGITALIQLTAFQSALLTSSAFEKTIAPHELYEVVNMIICEINKNRIGSDKFMTENYFLFNEGTITYAGTHLIGLLYRKGEKAVTELDGLANRTAFMGISSSISAIDSEGQFSMQPDDILLLYTDGIIEAKNNFSHQFGLERLKEILAAGASLPLEEVYDNILAAVRDHARDGDLKKYRGKFADDASVVLIRKL